MMVVAGLVSLVVVGVQSGPLSSDDLRRLTLTPSPEWRPAERELDDRRITYRSNVRGMIFRVKLVADSRAGSLLKRSHASENFTPSDDEGTTTQSGVLDGLDLHADRVRAYSVMTCVDAGCLFYVARLWYGDSVIECSITENEDFGAEARPGMYDVFAAKVKEIDSQLAEVRRW